VTPQFALSGILRGDLKSRYETYRLGRECGVLSPDDCRRFEKLHVERIMRRTPDKKEAARKLGMGLSSLYRRIAELGIQSAP